MVEIIILRLFAAVFVEGLPQTFVPIEGKEAVLIFFLGHFGGTLA